MLIRTFVVTVINNERKTLTHHGIIDCIKSILQNKLSRSSRKCAKNQSSGFIRTYGGQVSHLLTHLSSLTFREREREREKERERE